ncbi:MAG: L-threonylcarbamoyladenylate synthase [Eubacteriales bacterium]|nr:L-threonylcarbamoyladenylate synthase [Eubacteriales bacterium]
MTQVISTISQPEAGTSMGAELIKKGELVAFPTETVYGLGANGLNADAVEKIFIAKGRPNDNPLILHVAKKSDVKRLWAHVPKIANVLMDTFWPGPLTLIFNRADCVPNAVTAGLDTVAVRMPQDKTARMLIQKSDVPIAAPSANLSGKPSPTTARHVLEDMDGRIPLILDGGACKYGVESTVLSLVGKPTILRPGAVTREMLEAVIGQVELAGSILSPLKEREVALSPGMKYKHYAPTAQVIVVCGEPRLVAKRILELYMQTTIKGEVCEIAATKQTQNFYRGKQYSVMGDRDDPMTLCSNLFALLRDMDTRCDVILAEGVDTSGSGLAFMNRLLRAAGFSVEYI